MRDALNSTSLMNESSKLNFTTLLTAFCRRSDDRKSSVCLVERLLNLGANPDKTDANPNDIDNLGLTCLDYAEALGCKGLVRAIRNGTVFGKATARQKNKILRSVSKLVMLVRRFLLRRFRRRDGDGIIEN